MSYSSTGSFPKEFSASLIDSPDIPFILTLVACLLVVGGGTFLLSLRELPQLNREVQIVEIQKRYARLILNRPQKAVKPPGKIIKEEKKAVKLEKPKENMPQPPMPKVDIKPANKYKIKETKVKIKEDKEDNISINSISDIGNDRLSKKSRYELKGKDSALLSDFENEEGLALSSLKKFDSPRPSSVKKYGRGSLNSGAVVASSALIDEDIGMGRSRNSTIVGTKQRSRYKTSLKDEGAAGLKPSPLQNQDRTSFQTQKKVPSKNEYGSGRYNRRAIGSKVSSSDHKSAIEKEKLPMKKTAGTSQLPETADVHHLKACADPNRQDLLKRNIIAELSRNKYYCEDSYGKYLFLNAEMLSTLEVRVSSNVKVTQNRCDALELALGCLTKERRDH